VKKTDEQRIRELQAKIDKRKARDELKKTLEKTKDALRKLR
jgi:hypothetical protein